MENLIRVRRSRREAKLLAMQGADQEGNLYQVDNISFLRNGKRFFPVMGEFHFSRYEPEDWEEELLKLRAGGVEIVATYVFWIHHEERRGEWNFEGCRNLHACLEVCRRISMPVWLRIGPWAHGECRNGGFPDWVVSGNWAVSDDQDTAENLTVGSDAGKWASRNVRTNHPAYLELVRAFYGKIGEQARGELWKDGGPILGIQLENEYGHCGGPSDVQEGLAHMRTLKRLAAEAGLTAPYYTATGWGGAYVVDGETLPVLGGYVDAPWDCSVDELPANENFVFAPYRQDENIGSDLKREEQVRLTYDPELSPYLTAELGAGLQVTAHRRTYPWPADIESQALCMLGSGANLLGYYMYHGGINPDGQYSTLQESRTTGYINDLPVKSYDFQTCIRESGELNESYGRLKKLHLLLQDFGWLIAGSETYFAELQPQSAEDLETLRVTVRVNFEAGAGFLFVNNHQRKRRMKDQLDAAVRLVFEDVIESEKESDKECDKEPNKESGKVPGREAGKDIGGRELFLPHLCVKGGECAVIPFLVPEMAGEWIGKRSASQAVERPERQEATGQAGEQIGRQNTGQVGDRTADHQTGSQMADQPGKQVADQPGSRELNCGSTLRLPVRTNASLLCRIGARSFYYVGSACEPYFEWRDEPEDIVVLTREQADRAFRSGDRLYITERADSCVFSQDGHNYLLTKNPEETLTIYGGAGEPRTLTGSGAAEGNPTASGAQKKAAAIPDAQGRGTFTLVKESRDADGSIAYREYCVKPIYRSGDCVMERLRAGTCELHQQYLAIDYLGDRAEVYLDGRLADDWFTTGEQWHLALKRFGYPEELTLRIYPSDKPLPNPYGNRVYYDLPVENGCMLQAAAMLTEYKIQLD